MRKYLSYIILVASLLIGGCSSEPQVKNKTEPNYSGVDIRVKKIYDEYLYISAQHNLKFDKPVTIGFTDINAGRVIGVCYSGPGFREIDLDNKYWFETSKISQLSLMFHELTHCFCARAHDYNDGTMYPDGSTKNLQNFWNSVKHFFNKNLDYGFYKDGCAKSIMNPVLVDDDCMLKHYNEYIEEMQNRCEPW